MAQRYAISSLREAEAYLKHPVLGPRLRECTRLVLQVDGKSAHDILGSPDDLKFHSCLTLFARAAPDEELFNAALDKIFDGRDVHRPSPGSEAWTTAAHIGEPQQKRRKTCTWRLASWC